MTIDPTTYLNIFTNYTVDELEVMSISKLKELNIPQFVSLPANPLESDITEAYKSFLSPYVENKGSVVTSVISVTNKPAAVGIQTQPPSVIYVGDPFQVTVKAVISSGSPAARAVIKAAVQPASSTIAQSSSITDYMFSLASGSNHNFTFFSIFLETSIQELSALNNVKNIILDPSSTSSKTNKNGIAFFTLRLLTGIIRM